MSEELYERMKKFYNESPLPQKVTKPLKEGAVAEVEFDGDPATYMMIKEGGRSLFKPGKPKKPEVYMKFNRGAVDYLLAVKGDDEKAIEEYVSRLGECVLNPTPERWLQFKLCANVLTGARMGYFGMMRMGGRKAFDLALKLGIKIPKKFLS